MNRILKHCHRSLACHPVALVPVRLGPKAGHFFFTTENMKTAKKLTAEGAEFAEDLHMISGLCGLGCSRRGSAGWLNGIEDYFAQNVIHLAVAELMAQA
jgi:hypothetical protein